MKKVTPTPADKPKLLIYSDCWFLSGSEEMPVQLLGSGNLSDAFELTFAFRYSKRYQSDLAERLGGLSRTIAVRTFDPNMIHRWSLNRRSRTLRALCAILALSLSPIFFALNYVFLYILLLRQQPSIVHINNGGYPGAQSCRTIALVSRTLGIKAISMTVNNQAITKTGLLRRWPNPLERCTVASVDRFITGSISARTTLTKVLKLGPEDAVCINNGVQLKRSKGPAEKWVANLEESRKDFMIVGMVANHETRKGHRFLLEALARHIQIDASIEHLRFVIEGDGPEFENNLRLAGRLGLASRVTFIGRIINVHDFMASVDAVIVPSLWGEDFPNVISEAMALGKPVVAANIAGIPEQLEGIQAGFLFEAGDEKGLIAALNSLVEGLHQNPSMGLASAAKFQRCYTVEVAAAKYRQLFEELLDEGKSSHARA